MPEDENLEGPYLKNIQPAGKLTGYALLKPHPPEVGERFWRALRNGLDLETSITFEEADERMRTAPNDPPTMEWIDNCVRDIIGRKKSE